MTDDTLIHIAHFLPTSRDLMSVQLSCPRFAAKIFAAPGAGGGVSGSAGDAVDCGGGHASVGGGVQPAGTRVGTSLRGLELAGSGAGGGGASVAAGVRSGACRYRAF